MNIDAETKRVIIKVQREIEERNKEEQEKARKKIEQEKLRLQLPEVVEYKKQKSILPKKLIVVLRSFNTKKK